MKPGQQIAIWIHHQAAKLILALPDNHPISRWVIIGEFLDLPSTPIGAWIHVQFFEERRPMGSEPNKHVRYGIKPGQCVIRWDYIIAIQNLKDAETPVEDPRPIGFLNSQLTRPTTE